MHVVAVVFLYSWEYKYCCEKCWQTSAEYQNAGQALEVLFNSLKGWQQAIFMNIFEKYDDEILADWFYYNQKKLTEKMEINIEKEQEKKQEKKQEKEQKDNETI